MKRIAALLVVLLAGLSLYGCGIKDRTTSSDSGNATSNSGGESNVGFTLNLVDQNNASRAVVLGNSATALPTDVRVVIRSFTTTTSIQTVCQYDENDILIPGSCIDVTVSNFTEVYKDIQDVPYSNSITVGIPAGSGYTLDVITSQITGAAGNHSILKYGQATNVDVPGTGNATVLMQPLYNILNMTVADSVVSKGKIDVSLNNVLPFANRYTMTMTFTADPTATSVVSTSTNTTTFTAPASYSTGDLEFQGRFTLNSSMLMRGESSTRWTRLYPDTAYGERAYSNLIPLVAVTLPGI
jgi:hypothetical protein